MTAPFKHWSTEEDQRLIGMLSAGKSYNAIAFSLKRSALSCLRRFQRLNCPMPEDREDNITLASLQISNESFVALLREHHPDLEIKK